MSNKGIILMGISYIKNSVAPFVYLFSLMACGFPQRQSRDYNRSLLEGTAKAQSDMANPQKKSTGSSAVPNDPSNPKLSADFLRNG